MAGWAGFPASGLVSIAYLFYDARNRPGFLGTLEPRGHPVQESASRPALSQRPRGHAENPVAPLCHASRPSRPDRPKRSCLAAIEDSPPSSKVQGAWIFRRIEAKRFVAWYEMGQTICYTSI